ncbi:MAG: hypothetical protein KJ072_11480 [Verrucomicrobia bacterium]|nr:hypothetical protein [Verrucomicrobiota bacterium]
MELGKALTELVEGAITNYQFPDLSRSWGCADRAVSAIGDFFVELCTDEREYRLTEFDPLDASNRAIADRSLLFLKTDREYEWPEAPSMALQAGAGGAAVFLLLPFGIVLLIAALVFWDATLVPAGIACLGLSGLLFWWWSRRQETPEWRAYWANGDRQAWPFLHQANFEQALNRLAQSGRRGD